MVTDSAPANGRSLDRAPALLHVDLDPFPGRPAVGARERPRHLEDARAVDDRLHSEPGWPRVRAFVLDERVAGCVEADDGLKEKLLVPVREPVEVAVKALGPLEPHDVRLRRCSRNSSASTARPRRPAAMSSSASRSIRCQRSVQNQA
jgi:hypothetical protein